MNILHLRTMSRKSVFDWGNKKYLSVQQVIDLGSQSYLGYAYFHYEKITFLPDILEELRINNNFIIKKPGKNPDLFKDWKNYFYDQFEWLERVKKYNRSKKCAKSRERGQEIKNIKSKSFHMNKNRKIF